MSGILVVPIVDCKAIDSPGAENKSEHSSAQGTDTLDYDLGTSDYDRESLAGAQPELTLLLNGTEQGLGLPLPDLFQGEVWRAFTITFPGAQVEILDSIECHEALGGPAVNHRVVDPS